MRSIICTLLCIVAFYQPSWTQEERIIELKTDPSLIKVEEVPFNNVVVWDNRLDTTQVGLALVGTPNQLVPVCFQERTDIAIRQYILSSIHDLQTKPQTLFVNLKKLLTFEKSGVNYERGLLEFSADAYIQRNNGLYIKVYSHDTLFTTAGVDVTKNVLRKIQEPIDSMICKICKCSLNNEDTLNQFSLHEIISGIRTNWATYPINTAKTKTIGIYRSFEDFRENRIDSLTYVAMILYDGKYSVYHLTKDNLPDKKRPFTGIWGICDGNKIYYRIHEIFVLLEKKNYTFYFTASIQDFFKHKDPSGGEVLKIASSYNKKVLSPYDQLYGPMSGLMVNSIVTRGRKLQFYFDMDTGRVIEYRLSRNNLVLN